MQTSTEHGVRWRELFARRGFPYFFTGMLVSLFGTGMNFAGVTWYTKAATGSTVMVSVLVILVTLPGLVVPFFGGVLIDRVDRRYLGMALDLSRGAVVLGIASLAWLGVLRLWELFAMVTFLGTCFGIYWSTTNALVQEVMAEPGGGSIPMARLVGANSAVLIAVQGGMMTAGAVVGFVYERAGLGGILTIDGATYLISAYCLFRLRRGYFAPHHLPAAPPVATPTIEAPPEMTEPAVLPEEAPPETVTGFLAQIGEGLQYLRTQPRVLALGVTFACMMAGVISSNVVLVALAMDLLHAGPVGYGWLEFGWAIGAVGGGLAAARLSRHHPHAVMIAAMAILAVGHTLFPYVTLLGIAVAMQALFGACRALGGVLTQSSIMTTVPRRLMGRTQSAFSVISTLLQVAMSFSLGWLAERWSLTIAFLAVGLLYGAAVWAALRARSFAEAAARTAPAS